MEEEIDVEQYLPAIAKAAWIAYRNLPPDSAVDLEDLVSDGVIFFLEYVVPTWNPEKSNFLTHCTRATWQFFDNRIKKDYRRRELAQENLIFKDTGIDSYSSVFTLDLLNSISDGALEVLDLLLNPTEGLKAKMRMAKHSKRELSGIREALKCRGFDWDSVCGEFRWAIANYLE